MNILKKIATNGISLHYIKLKFDRDSWGSFLIKSNLNQDLNINQKIKEFLVNYSIYHFKIDEENICFETCTFSNCIHPRQFRTLQGNYQILHFTGQCLLCR